MKRIVFSFSQKTTLFVLFCIFFFLPEGNALETTKPSFVFFTGSYNNEQWVKRYIQSLANQTYQNWECIYVNDASTDNTAECISKYIRKYHLEGKITLINHEARQGLIANMFSYIHNVDPKKIIVIVDGDDFLAHPRVLEKLSHVYSNPSVWTTYGNYQPFPKKRNHSSVCQALPKSVIKENTFRKYAWRSSHLRTFYAKLFQLIRPCDLQENGNFFQIAGDLATMYPILEMSSKGHIRFIPDVLLFYNTENSLSDYHRMVEVTRVSNLIRSLPPYTPIDGPLFSE